MKNPFLLVLLLLLAGSAIHAQTKVFKAVAEDMDQDFKAIFQDGKLVGYLAFTQLEKASVDSFNYRLTIMDENLNDIGTVNFRNEKLNLKGVSFDQDVLCLAYIKSNFVGKVYRNAKEFRRDMDNARTSLYTQFLSLDGKIIATNNIKMDIKPQSEEIPTSVRKLVGNGRLKQSLQLSNISGKGFVCFYGDDSKNNLAVFSAAGKLMWQKQIREDATGFGLLTSGSDVSLLAKTKDKMQEGGFEILSYNAIDSSAYPKFLLKDKKGNELKVLSFDNDPVSGKPYVAGLVIDPGNGNSFSTGRGIVQGAYCGIFSIDIAGHTKKDIHARFSYWTDGSQTFVDKNGYYEQTRGYAYFQNAFRDFQGNTWFAANNIHRHPRWGSIVSSVVFAPIFVIPIVLMVPGTHKYSSESVTLVKQDSLGRLALASSIPTPLGIHYMAREPVYYMNHHSYFNVSNPDSRSNYLVIDGFKDINIYNVSQKKIQRTIPHVAGKTEVSVFPAKEGYVMVHEVNLKEQTTRLSIEAL